MTAGILFISLSILSFGVGNCLWVWPLKRLNFLQVIILRSFLTAVLFAGLIVVSFITDFPEPLKDDHMANVPALTEVLSAVAICGFSYFGLYFYTRSLKEEKVGIAVPVSSINSLFGVLFGILVLNEPFSYLLLVLVLAFAFAIYLIDYKPVKTFSLSNGVMYNLAAAFFWGVGFAMFVFPVKAIGVLFFSFLLETTVCIFSIALYRMQAGRWFFALSEIDIPILLLAVAGFGGVIFYNYSLLYLPVSMISALNALVPAVSVVISSIVLRERLRALQYVGVMIIILCLLLLEFR